MKRLVLGLALVNAACGSSSLPEGNDVAEPPRWEARKLLLQLDAVCDAGPCSHPPGEAPLWLAVSPDGREARLGNLPAAVPVDAGRIETGGFPLLLRDVCDSFLDLLLDSLTVELAAEGAVAGLEGAGRFLVDLGDRCGCGSTEAERGTFRIRSFTEAPFEPPVFLLRNQPPLWPTDPIFLASVTSPFLVEHVGLDPFPAGAGPLELDDEPGFYKHAFIRNTPLAFGTTSTLVIRGRDFSDAPVEFYQPLPVVAFRPGEPDLGFESMELAGYAARGVAAVERGGGQPGSGSGVAVSGAGKLAFRVEAPATANPELVLDAWAVGGDATIRVTIEAPGARYVETRDLQATEPMAGWALPLGDTVRTVNTASPRESLRLPLAPWAGEELLVTLAFTGSERDCVGVASGIVIDDIRLQP